MTGGSGFTERELAEIERGRDPAVIPALVRALRQQEHELDRLRLSLEVTQRDREELRSALIRAQEEARRLREQP